jgi:carboxylesterase 2
MGLAQVSGVFASLAGTVLTTPNGPVQGIAAFNSTTGVNITNWQNVTVWKGLSYAATTAGTNRFRVPQPVTPWNTTLVASDFGPGCPASQGNSATVDEDCLVVNVWSAASTVDDKLPVILWSHPAGGSSADELFDGGGMAAKGVIFVNYNYRDGAFGWLATPELSEELYATTGSNSSGNWGLFDMFAALNWTRANIASFGGDPDMITVAGQSAGSAASYHMVNSPLTKGLIKHAIAESGVRDPRDPEAGSLAESYNNLTTALSLGATFLADNNVTTIEELRAIPLADLVDYSSQPGSGSGFRPTLDFYAIPATYAETLLTGPANDVPFITGNAKDESGAVFGENTTVAAYTASIEAYFGNLSATALELYPAANDSQASMSFNAHWTDQSRVSVWGYASGWAKTASSPIYTYLWDHAPPGQTQGAYHESEINYVLNNLYGTDLPWAAEDYAIAEKMSSYWANFAKTGDPNLGGSYAGGDGLVAWTPTVSNETTTMELGDGWGPEPIAKSQAHIDLIIEFFDEQVPY